MGGTFIFNLDGNCINSFKMKALIIIFCMLLNISCKSIFSPEDDKLYMEREDYIGTQIRLDGYYHRISYENKIFGGYFFYQNGIIASLDGVEKTILEYDEYAENLSKSEDYKNQKSTWGVFIIRNDSIFFERLYPAQPYQAYIREGVVLNDTTFCINSSYRMVKGKKTEVREKNEIYHFKQFSPKPDSTNNFIK